MQHSGKWSLKRRHRVFSKRIPSVLRHCWSDNRKGIRPVKISH